MNMKQYETFELRFGGEVLPDAWAQIDLTATFSCAQESLTVKGFYDGESDGQGVYVVRFLPQYAGVYRYQVRGAVTAEGEIVCEASSPEAHGIVRAVGTHFAFADGAPYIPFGTTVYALISQDDALVEQTLQSLAAAPFNKLRLCVFPRITTTTTMSRRCTPLRAARMARGTHRVQASPSISVWNASFAASPRWAFSST